MAGTLVECITCGHKVSTNASACPNCGERDFIPLFTKEYDDDGGWIYIWRFRGWNIPASSGIQKTCEKCNGENSANCKYCDGIGWYLIWSDTKERILENWWYKYKH